MSELHSSEPEELGLLAALLGVAPARLISIEELNVLGNFLVAVGSIVLVIAAQAELLRVQNEEKEKEAKDTKKDNTTPSVEEQIRELREQLQSLIGREKT
jgi:hypothetical protein